MTAYDAIAQVDTYIDVACLANLAQITVVHGKGTGALRKGLHNYFKQLKKQKRISGYRVGVYGEGDLGVSVVILYISEKDGDCVATRMLMTLNVNIQKLFQDLLLAAGIEPIEYMENQKEGETVG